VVLPGKELTNEKYAGYVIRDYLSVVSFMLIAVYIESNKTFKPTISRL